VPIRLRIRYSLARNQCGRAGLEQHVIRQIAERELSHGSEKRIDELLGELR
jgi:hypothetical protein